jgi:hypothetical protein
LKFFSGLCWDTGLPPRPEETRDLKNPTKPFPHSIREIPQTVSRRIDNRFSARTRSRDTPRAFWFCAVFHFSATEADPFHQNDELDRIPATL